MSTSDVLKQMTGPVRVTVPRLVVAGTGAEIGTSAIVLGLLFTLKKRGFHVAASKIGPSLIEPSHHRRITGRLSHSLDPWMLTRDELLVSFACAGSGAELLIIEAEKGLFDRRGDGFAFIRDADVAEALSAPVVLVVDGRDYQESVAALVQGFVQFDRNVDIAAVIANRVVDQQHNQRIKEAIESLNGPTYLGGIVQGFKDIPESRGIDVGGENESLLTGNQLLKLGNLIESHLDVGKTVEIAYKARMVDVPGQIPDERVKTCRVGVADDPAFHLTIQDNLDLLRRSGAELTAFSTLADHSLPEDIQGIYLPGGYPYLYLDDLQANTSMLNAIRLFVQDGGVVYAEGDAQSYLCDRIVLPDGTSFDMVGAVPVTAVSCYDQSSSPTRAYVEMVATENTILSRYSSSFKGIRDNRWMLRQEEDLLTAFRVREYTFDGKRGSDEALVSMEGILPVPNTLTSRSQIHWGSALRVAESFVVAATRKDETSQD